MIGAGLVTALLFLATGLELIREFGSGRELRLAVDRSYETRLQIQQVFSLLQDAETGQRGYVITGTPSYLEPYSGALDRLDSQMDRLGDLFAAEPEQQADLKALERITDRKLANMATSVRLRQAGGDQAAVAAVSSGQGKVLMDQVRVLVTRMVDREAEALSLRSKQAEQRTVQTERLVGGLFFALLLSVAGAGFLVWRYLATRRAMMGDLRAALSRQQVIFDSAIDAIITLNPSGSIETVNTSAERMFGYASSDLIRRDISLLIDIASDGDGEFLKRLGASQGALNRGLIRQMEARGRDGQTFPVDVALGAMELPTGTHVVAVVRDISERQRVEQMKDEFVSTVSHELRTPLTSIAGSLGLLAGGAAGPLPEKATRLVQIAQSNSQRLVRLINDILDIEKIESGKLRLDLAPLDLRAVAARSIESVKGFADEYGVTLTLVDGDTAPVRGDEDRLIQVVTNLLSNASKFSPVGGSVSITVDRETRLARLSVRDQGPGIPDAFRSSIFSKFAQADGSDTRAKGGTGLGLAISREIAERHGGRLWFESAPGEGAVFHLDLPLAHTGSTAAPQSDGPRLLIVEDDPDAADVLREMLEQDGFTADVATTAREALEAAVAGGYSAALVDLNLPDVDGISLIRSLREHEPTRDLPVVVVSADIGAGKGRARSLEVLDWLEKPFDQTRLRSAVTAIYRRNGDGRPLVLHVDDDRDILEVTAATLASSADIVPAGSLAAARAVLARQTPDLVILDLGLPDGSGLELLAELGDDRRGEIPVIVYSAQEMDGALSDRVDTVLTKSRASLANLARTVRRLTDKKTNTGTGKT